MPNARSTSSVLMTSVTSARRAGRVPVGSILAVSLVFLMVSSGLLGGRAAAASCEPGWTVDADVNNSFTWADGGLTPTNTVTWTGSVQLLVERDQDCNVLGVEVAFTIQFPIDFTSYANKGQNAYGDLTSWNPPAGDYLTYRVKTNFDINGRGADEFAIKGIGVPAVVSNVGATFTLPLDLLGNTVKAQIHVGPDKG